MAPRELQLNDNNPKDTSLELSSIKHSVSCIWKSKYPKHGDVGLVITISQASGGRFRVASNS